MNDNLDNKIELYFTELIMSIEQNHFASNAIIPRSSYKSFYNTFNNLRTFILDNEVINYFKSAIKIINPLFKKLYNPYPLINKEIHSFYRRIPKSLTIIDYKPESTNTKFLYKHSFYSNTDKSDVSVFGLFTIVKNCDSYSVTIQRNLAKQILPVEMKTFTLTSKSSKAQLLSIQSILSLTGNSVFLGTIFPFVESFDFRIDFLMTIPSSETKMATDLFYDAINNHMLFLVKSRKAVILDIKIPDVEIKTPVSKSKPIKNSEEIIFNKYLIWSYNDWQNDELNARDIVNKLAEIYISKMIEESKNIPFIVVEFVIPTNDQESEFTTTIKIRYVSNILQRKQSNQEEMWLTKESLFIPHLFESIFFDQASAEVFMSFILHTFFDDKDFKNPQSSTSTASSADELIGKTSTNKVKEVFGMFKFPDNDYSINKLDESKISEIGTDKTKFDHEKLEKYKKFIQDQWIDKIKKSRKIIDFFTVLENVMRLLLFDSEFIPNKINCDTLKREIIFVINSCAYKLYNIIQLNIRLRQLFYCYNEHSQSEMLIKAFQNFMDKFQCMIKYIKKDGSLTFFSQMIEKTELRVKSFLTRMEAEGEKKTIIDPLTMLELRYYNRICYCLLWQLIGDILIHCQQLDVCICTIVSQKSNDQSKNEILLQKFEFSEDFDFLNYTPVNSNPNVEPTNNKLFGIIEYLEKKNFRYYCNEFLLNIINNNHHHNLQSHPFSILSYQFHLASIKLDIDSVDLRNFVTIQLNASIELINSDCDIYKLKNYEAYGLKSSLHLLDIKAIEKLKDIIKSFDYKPYPNRIGLFEIYISNGFSGQLLYHGIVDPHLRLMELVDNIYIRGPRSCLEEASQLFAQTVVKYLLDFKDVLSSNKYISLGLFVQETNQRWSMEDIVRNVRGSIIQISKCVQEMYTIVSQIYVPNQSRYLPIVKYFHFHFISRENFQRFNSTNDDYFNLEVFQLVFLNKESAEIYFNMNGFTNMIEKIPIVERLIDKRLIETFLCGNWIKLYQLLIMKSLIIEDFEFVKEASKIFRSTLGHLDYLNLLNKTMQYVIFSILESEDFTTNQNPQKQVDKSKNKNNTTQVSNQTILTNSFRFYYFIFIKLLNNKNLEHIHLFDQLLTLINEICYGDSNPESVNLIVSLENIQKLEEIRQIIEILENTFGYSSLESNQKSRAYLNQIINEEKKHKQ